ncbi:MAG: methyltransferase domain-containing protein [Candidatus Azambacteria bacterium]|nr:methyltransferase domain-containing protein [Candidatus Azambacteria bacterium]
MIKCPICKNSDEKLIRNSFLPKFRYCTVCGGHFLIGEHAVSYPEEYFSENTEPSKVAKIAAPILDFFYKLRVNKIKKLLKNKSNPKILDYGCGAGKLVQMLNEEKITAVGFEPSVGARQIAIRKNLPVYHEIKTVEGGYDLVMFWHSLEHTDNPFEVIEKAKEYLSREGKLLIAVPNADSFESRIAKEKWFHYLYPLHKVQFTPRALEVMLGKVGFKVAAVDFFNPEHAFSGLLQTFLHFFMPKYAFYGAISHRQINMPVNKAILFMLPSLLLLTIFAPLLILFFLIELIFHKTGAILVIAKK